MIRLTTIYHSGTRASIRYVGTPEELASVIARALKGNVFRLEVDREPDPYDASQDPPVLGSDAPAALRHHRP